MPFEWGERNGLWGVMIADGMRDEGLSVSGSSSVDNGKF